MRPFVLAFLVCLAIGPYSGARAVEPDEILSDPAIEARARTISKSLRCLVCQNQSIDDSNADLAKDLRLLVRERLVAGDTDAVTIEYIVARYGDYVLLKPPFKARTFFLWAGPPAIFVLGVLALVLYFRRGRKDVDEAPPLSAEERKRLEAALDAAPPE